MKRHVTPLYFRPNIILLAILILLLSFISISIYFSPHSDDSEKHDAGLKLNERINGQRTQHLPQKRPQRSKINASMVKAAANTVDVSTLSEPRIVIHSATNFSAGKSANLLVDGGLRLTTDVSPAMEGEDIIGVYVSPEPLPTHTPEEQMQTTFDCISLSYEGTVPQGSQVQFEFRTIAYDEDGEGWGDWQEVNMAGQYQVVVLDRLAQKWQYRFILSAPNAASSPEIRNVTVVTQRTPQAQAQVHEVMEIVQRGSVDQLP